MPCAMPWGLAGDGSGAPEPVRHGPAMPVSVRTKAGWSMGGMRPANPSRQRDGRDPSASLGTDEAGAVLLSGAPSPGVIETRKQRACWLVSACPASLPADCGQARPIHRTVGDRCRIAISPSRCAPASEAPTQGWACRNGLPGNRQVPGEVPRLRLTGEGSERDGACSGWLAVKLWCCHYREREDPAANRALDRTRCRRHHGRFPAVCKARALHT